jgi:hypothetical protein
MEERKRVRVKDKWVQRKWDEQAVNEEQQETSLLKQKEEAIKKMQKSYLDQQLQEKVCSLVKKHIEAMKEDARI